jgi:hypothetical protein
VDPFFAWLEDSALSTWIRSSPSVVFGFPGILVLHALGMAFLAGASIALSLCTLGLAPGLPTASFRGFVPVLWIALVVNVFSGVLLVIGYPTKALTNPLFYGLDHDADTAAQDHARRAAGGGKVSRHP